MALTAGGHVAEKSKVLNKDGKNLGGLGFRVLDLGFRVQGLGFRDGKEQAKRKHVLGTKPFATRPGMGYLGRLVVAAAGKRNKRLRTRQP